MLDIDAFEERAAIAEYDGGLSRFDAETLAAKAQGFNRWEALNEIRQRNSEQARHHGQADEWHDANDLSGVQPQAAQQDGQVLVGDVQAGRGGVDMLALRVDRRRVSR